MIVATGQIYQIDDYGWALAGRNTIDLYCPSRSEMNEWGVRPRHDPDLGMGRSLAKLSRPQTAFGKTAVMPMSAG